MILIRWLSLSLLKSLGTKWGIQILVVVSLACQIVVAVLGSRRKYITHGLVRFVIWAAYVLLTYVATIALGKLTGVGSSIPANPSHHVVAKGLLAPLLLMQLGYSGGIAAYAVEDDRMGLRQTGRIVAKAALVAWILVHSWDSSVLVSWLYFFLFVVGIMRSPLWVRALLSVYDDENSIVGRVELIPDDGQKFHSANHILMAYRQFGFLKLQLPNWPYQPLSISEESKTLANDPPDHAFTTIEIELNFMFDMIYSKSTVLYTKLGFIGLFISFFCLVSALSVFVVIFRSSFLIDKHITYTLAILMAVTSVELHQTMALLFSDWVVVMMSMKREKPLVRRFLVRRFLPFLADQCMKQRRWSRSIGQLNLLDHCHLYKEWPKPVEAVIGSSIKREIFWSHLWHSRQDITSRLKELVIQKMTELEKKRRLLPFTKRGKWTLETHGVQENETLRNSIETEFGKSIIIWHAATKSLHLSETNTSDACGGSKCLSDYMMYLLVMHPHAFPRTTDHAVLESACRTLRNFLRGRHPREVIGKLDVTNLLARSGKPGQANDWDVLSEVKKLVVELRTMDNKWELISSIWVEMLCYAAYNCPEQYHAEQMRRGGELITHVWLLLVHRTQNPDR